MIVDRCPHCGTRHVQTAEHFHIAAAPGSALSWKVLRCQNVACQTLMLAEIDQQNKIISLFPAAGAEIEAGVPVSQELRDDFREAAICLSAGCNKASLVMSRRVLQRCLKDQGIADRNLVDAVKAAVDNSVLRKSFHYLADEIRHYGNLSAHPDDDQLQSANRESAETILEFARLLVHEFYEVPAAAARLKKSRTP